MNELEICYCLGLLPPLPPPPSISFTQLFLVWAQIFPFPSVFIFSPASFQCLCTFSLPPLLSSVPFVCIPFISKPISELTPGCLFPAALNWRFGKRRLQFPQGARQSSVSVLFLNMHLNMADQRSKRNLWVLSAGSS